MRKSILLATALAVALPVTALGQSNPFGDWPEPSRPAANPAPIKKPAAKPVPVAKDPARAEPAKAEPAKADPAKAAPAKVPEAKQQPKVEPLMKVALVRATKPECEPDCPEWISAEGRIDAGTARDFRRVFSKLGNRSPPVFLSSLGGDVDQAYAIAKMVRSRGLDVVIAKTDFQPCAPDDKACRQHQAKGWLQGAPSTQRTICASACPIILAGGVRRFVGPDAFLGVHQIQTIQTPIRVTRTYRVETRTSWGVPVSQKKTLVSEKREALRPQKKETPTDSYIKLRDFFKELGIDQSIVMLYLAAPHDKIHWITRGEQLSTRIATHFVGPARVLAGDIMAPTLPSRAPAASGSAPPAPGMAIRCSPGLPITMCDPRAAAEAARAAPTEAPLGSAMVTRPPETGATATAK